MFIAKIAALWLTIIMIAIFIARKGGEKWELEEYVREYEIERKFETCKSPFQEGGEWNGN